MGKENMPGEPKKAQKTKIVVRKKFYNLTPTPKIFPKDPESTKTAPTMGPINAKPKLIVYICGSQQSFST